MAKRRKPKFSNFKSADWDKYIRVKKGELPYVVDRAAPPEDKVLYGCGVIPFAFTPPSDAGGVLHSNAWISFAGAKIARSVLGTSYDNILGLEGDSDNSNNPVAGWYPAQMVVTLVGINDEGSFEESQLSTRRYRKKSTRSGSFPFGRRTIATPRANTGAPTTGVEDVDYGDALAAIRKAFNPEPASPPDAKVMSISSEPELLLPVSEIKKWLGTLGAIPPVTDF